MEQLRLSSRFSPRQVEIIGLIAAGASDKEIAARLGISIATVRTHLQRLYRDSDLRNRAEAVNVYWRMKAEGTLPSFPSEARRQDQSLDG
jgi:DNA-binding NarL/FixJ family response regulator